MEEGKKRSLTIGKETIEVSEEVYRAYMRPDKSGKPKETQAMEMQSTQRKQRTLLSL